MPNIAITKSVACSGGYGQITVGFSAIYIDDYTITLTGDNSGEVHTSLPFMTASGGTFTFNGLPNDLWVIEISGVTTGGTASTTATTSCVPIAPVNDLTLNAVGTNQTENEFADGKISIAVTTSHPPFKTKLNSGAFTTGKTLYTALAPGTYTVTAEDAAGFTKQQVVYILSPPPSVPGCTDPNATNYDPAATVDNGTCVFPRPAAVFFVPMLNSLRFVTEVTANNCNSFPTLDNKLFCKTKNGNYNPGYLQKVANCDVMVFQFRSNYTSNVIKLHDLDTGAQVGASLVHEMKVAKVSAREFTLDCEDLPAGRYYLSIAATDADYPAVTAVSEPFLVKAQHENMHLITYRNSVNKFDMVYATGIEHSIRVESLFFKRKPTGESGVMRDCNDNLILLSSTSRRRVLLETFMLPDWVHEKLSVVFRHNQVKVNGVDFATDENYEFDYMTRFALSNGSIILEQVGWFTAGNASGAEIGGSGSGYLLANNGYLEVTI